MKLGLYIAFLFFSCHAIAQSITILPERESILLGEQNVLRISLPSAFSPEELLVYESLPAVKMSTKKEKDSLELEVLGFEIEADQLRLIVTAWDSGLLIIPPFALDQSGTLFTDATMFRVEFPPVDESGEIMDIYEVSFNIPLFQDFSEKYWWLIDLLILALFVIGLLLVLREKDVVEVFTEPEIIIPIEEIARTAIYELFKKEQFAGETQKLHFAEFSDILRRYMSGRYGIVTFEKTTFELLNALRLKSVPVEHRGIIEELLTISDMIKFSKATTDEVEIMRLKDVALHFISVSSDWNERDIFKQKGEPSDA